MNEEQAKIIMEEINKKFEHITDLKELYDYKIEQLGKKGKITALQAGIKEALDKKEYAKLDNMFKNHFNEIYEAKLKLLEEFNLKKKLESEKIDITLPATKVRVGSPNILEKVVEDMEELFISMGYDVVEGP